MATYEYRCRACGATFEERRAMADADAPATCPDGHRDTTRLFSVFASVSRSGGGTVGTGGRDAAPTPSAPAGGACCGGGCGCG